MMSCKGGGPHGRTPLKAPNLVGLRVRRIGSGAGSFVGATDLVAMLRRSQLGRSAQGIQEA